MISDGKIIGGSYALYRLLRAPWNPDDIDIYVAHDNNFAQRMLKNGCFVVEHFKYEDHNGWRKNVITGKQENISESHGNDRAEKFDEKIRETMTAIIPGISLPVQFIGVQSTPETLSDDLEMMTDLPASVQLTYDSEGNEIFKIPKRMMELMSFTTSSFYKNFYPIEIGQFFVFREEYMKNVTQILFNSIPYDEICPRRKAKYEKRGFIFTPINKHNL